MYVCAYVHSMHVYIYMYIHIYVSIAACLYNSAHRHL